MDFVNRTFDALFILGLLFGILSLTTSIFFIFRLKIKGKNLYEHASVITEAALPNPGVTTSTIDPEVQAIATVVEL